MSKTFLSEKEKIVILTLKKLLNSEYISTDELYVLTSKSYIVERICVV